VADEPDNLILQLLREIRGTLGDHGKRFDRVDQRLNAIEQRIDEVHETMYQVAGFAMHANVRHDTVTERLKALEDRVGRLEEKA
jgi:DNA repair ATPase RecN